MRKLLSSIDKSLALVENSLTVLIVTIMVLMAFFQVMLRNLFSTGILWGDIFLRHLVLWVGFIGASLATREEKHINIDILTRLTSPKTQQYLRIFTDLVTMGVCIVLAKAGYTFLTYEIEAGTVLFENIPSWIFQMIIPIGFALIAFRYFLKVAGRILDLVEGKQNEIPSPPLSEQQQE